MVKHTDAELNDDIQEPSDSDASGADSNVQATDHAQDHAAETSETSNIPHATDAFPAPDAADEDAGTTAQHQSALSSLPDLRQTLSDDPALDDAGADTSREEFTTVYDIIDHLEQTLNEAKGSIFSPSQARINRDEFNEQLGTLKGMLPVQLERASALMREAERRLENAQNQATAIVSSAQSRAAQTVTEAQDQAQFLAGQENVTDLARQQARAILDQAQAKSERLTQGADEYCTKVMRGLQEQLGKLNQDVNAGLEVLGERRQSAAEDYESIVDYDDDPPSEDA